VNAADGVATPFTNVTELEGYEGVCPEGLASKPDHVIDLVPEYVASTEPPTLAWISVTVAGAPAVKGPTESVSSSVGVEVVADVVIAVDVHESSTAEIE
jgi:hypothetical protein